MAPPCVGKPGRRQEEIIELQPPQIQSTASDFAAPSPKAQAALRLGPSHGITGQ